MVYLSEETMKQIFSWIENAVKQQKSAIFMHTCPDYAVEATGDPKRPYKHTFKSLGNEIGQIALRLLTVLPHLKTLLAELGINPRIIITIADYEAFCPYTLKKVNESKHSFLAKVKQSLIKFEQAAHELGIEAYYMTDLCGGEASWLNEVEQTKTYFNSKDFEHPHINSENFKEIALRRKCLYNRWYSKKCDSDKYAKLAINQAAEYAVIGKFISKFCENSLVLAADSELFTPFYSLFGDLPCVYFTRRYSYNGIAC